MTNSEHENNVVQENLGLVVSQVVRYLISNNDPNYDDYVQAGSIALLKAIRGYDPNRGAKLSTYAWESIQKAIQKEAHKLYNKYKRLPDNLFTENVDSIWEILPDNLTENEKQAFDLRLQNMSLSEIGQEMGYSKEWINQLLNSAIEKIKKANKD